jgi:hypothetical protein
MIRYHLNNAEHGQLLSWMMHPDKPYLPEVMNCLSVTREGNLLGGVTYDNLWGRSTQMHVASKDPGFATRKFMFMAFDLPFNHFKVDVIYGPIDSENKRAMRFAGWAGFVEEARLVGGSPTGDIVIMSMRKDHCRWLERLPTGWIT